MNNKIKCPICGKLGAYKSQYYRDIIVHKCKDTLIEVGTIDVNNNFVPKLISEYSFDLKKYKVEIESFDFKTFYERDDFEPFSKNLTFSQGNFEIFNCIIKNNLGINVTNFIIIVGDKELRNNSIISKSPIDHDLIDEVSIDILKFLVDKKRIIANRLAYDMGIVDVPF